MTLKRAHVTFMLRYDARKILAHLSKAAANGKGIYSRALPGDQSRRGTVAQWLREQGIPLVTEGRGRSTLWYVISQFPPERRADLASAWRFRAMGDYYTQLCRQIMALSDDPATEPIRRQMASLAVTIGAFLGYPLTEVTKDLQPSPLDTEVARLASRNGIR